MRACRYLLQHLAKSVQFLTILLLMINNTRCSIMSHIHTRATYVMAHCQFNHASECTPTVIRIRLGRQHPNPYSERWYRVTFRCIHGRNACIRTWQCASACLSCRRASSMSSSIPGNIDNQSWRHEFCDQFLRKRTFDLESQQTV